MFHPCTVKQLPDQKIIPSAVTAWKINPMNRPSGLDTPQRIAMQTTKYWSTGGVHLTVGFMEPISDTLANKLISFMNLWAATANVQFTRVKTGAQVRISRSSGGYWSYLGTDILHIPSYQQTMNLEGFDESMPDSEFYRVVCHETGHTLGFVHEHMRAAIVNRLDRQKTLAYFEATQGWSAQEVQEQVLTPLDERSLMSTPADVDSIMCYQLPGSITLDGTDIPGGLNIDPSDAAFAATVYPKAVVSPPPPPPTPPTSGTKISLVVDGKVVYSQ